MPEISQKILYIDNQVPDGLEAIGPTVFKHFSGENLVYLLILLFGKNISYLVFIEHTYDASIHKTGTWLSFSPQLIVT